MAHAHLTVADPDYPDALACMLLRYLLPPRTPTAFIRAVVQYQRPLLVARFPRHAPVRTSWGVSGNVHSVSWDAVSRCFRYVVEYGLGGPSEAHAAEGQLSARSGGEVTRVRRPHMRQLLRKPRTRTRTRTRTGN